MKVLSTGASSGIGRDMAKYLYELGYELYLVSKDKRFCQKRIWKNLKCIFNGGIYSWTIYGYLLCYATKNYVTSLSLAIYEELKKEKSNVKISIFCPGPVDTNFNNVADAKFNVPSISSKGC